MHLDIIEIKKYHGPEAASNYMSSMLLEYAYHLQSNQRWIWVYHEWRISSSKDWMAWRTWVSHTCLGRAREVDTGSDKSSRFA